MVTEENPISDFFSIFTFDCGKEICLKNKTFCTNWKYYSYVKYNYTYLNNDNKNSLIKI